MVEWKGLAGLTNLATGPAPRRSKRLKFRFEDQDEESSSVQDSRKVTSDDILESLQKQSGDRLQDTDLGEEEIADDDENVDEDIEDSIDGPAGPHSPLILRKAILSKHAHNNNRRFGFFILVLM